MLFVMQLHGGVREHALTACGTGMQAAPGRAMPNQGPPQPRKRRRLVKAADVASEQVLEQIKRRTAEKPINLSAEDEEAPEVVHSSSEDEGGPVKLGMHVDLTRGAVSFWAAV